MCEFPTASITTSKPTSGVPSRAPSRSADARRADCGSRATTSEAPAITAPWTALSPTAPQPITSTVSPGCARAVFNTAPSPVGTAQPSSAASSNGRSSGTGMTAFAPTTVSCANVAVPIPACTGVPSTFRSAPAPRSLARLRFAQMYVSPRTQK